MTNFKLRQEQHSTNSYRCPHCQITNNHSVRWFVNDELVWENHTLPCLHQKKPNLIEALAYFFSKQHKASRWPSKATSPSSTNILKIASNIPHSPILNDLNSTIIFMTELEKAFTISFDIETITTKEP